jgi:hypothetical protein
MKKRTFINDIEAINASILEAEKMLKEAMNFCEDDDMEMPAPEMEEEVPMDNEMGVEEVTPEVEGTVESYVDHIRKYSLNGLSALCDNPESEEYQMLKKIFQMCDKKPEKKEGMAESRRIFGVLKENKQVIFEVEIENPKEFNNFKKAMVENAKKNGVDPSKIRLVSENKIIC